MTAMTPGIWGSPAAASKYDFKARNAACDAVLVTGGSIEELRAKVDELARRLGVTEEGVRS